MHRILNAQFVFSYKKVYDSGLFVLLIRSQNSVCIHRLVYHYKRESGSSSCCFKGIFILYNFNSCLHTSHVCTCIVKPFCLFVDTSIYVKWYCWRKQSNRLTNKTKHTNNNIFIAYIFIFMWLLFLFFSLSASGRLWKCDFSFLFTRNSRGLSSQLLFHNSNHMFYGLLSWHILNFWWFRIKGPSFYALCGSIQCVGLYCENRSKTTLDSHY